jgi:hypothetical protein
MSKKRKSESIPDVDRSMYSSFVAAANAVSQLYTQGMQQQRRAAAAGSQATLVRRRTQQRACVPHSGAKTLLIRAWPATHAGCCVRLWCPLRCINMLHNACVRCLAVFLSVVQEKVVAFVLQENEGSEHISKGALLQFLQHEYEVRARQRPSGGLWCPLKHARQVRSVSSKLLSAT